MALVYELPGTHNAAKAPVGAALRMLAVFSLPTATSALTLRRERYELSGHGGARAVPAGAGGRLGGSGVHCGALAGERDREHLLAGLDKIDTPILTATLGRLPTDLGPHP